MCKNFTKPCDECQVNEVHCQDYPTICGECYEKTQYIRLDIHDDECDAGWDDATRAECGGPVDDFPEGKSDIYREVICRNHQHKHLSGLYASSGTGWP